MVPAQVLLALLNAPPNHASHLLLRNKPPLPPTSAPHACRGDPDVLWLHYEDLQEDLPAAVRLIAEFLDIGKDDPGVWHACSLQFGDPSMHQSMPCTLLVCCRAAGAGSGAVEHGVHEAVSNKVSEGGLHSARPTPCPPPLTHAACVGRYDEHMLKLARNPACGRPREAGLHTGKVGQAMWRREGGCATSPDWH